VTTDSAGIGRRERKKRETSAALRRAALALFAEKGFRDTRVSEIAERADVAEATFFRHFSSKEDVALVDLLARVDRLIAALEARPDDEGPLAACRALVDTPVGLGMRPGPDELLVMGLVAQDPSLSGHFFRQMAMVVERLAAEFGRRMGVAATELRPRLLASAVIGSLQAVLLTWLSHPGSDLTALSLEAFDVLAEGMDWPSVPPPGDPSPA
jgi:AcrR family transcriptional regulator